jgi:hypothetical protein
METRLLQVASSFTSIPIAKTLRPMVVNAGIAADLGFSQYSQMAEYMLGPASDSPQIRGTIILVRVEDWLRDGLKSLPAGTTSDAVQKARQSLRIHVDEFAGQVASLAQRGKPVWFLACPSTGWIAERCKLETLCRSFTNLLVTRVQSLPHVTNLSWPAALLSNSNSTEFTDRNADRLGQIPFTRNGFDRLGRFVGEQIERAFIGKSISEEFAPSAVTPDLAAYVSGLQVHVRLSPAKPGDRPHVDRILRTAAAFSLQGEKRDLAETEVDALLESGRCMLIRVSDRLSDHGASGLIAFSWAPESLVVDAMALSCPVLGKQVEYAVVSGLAQIAADRQCAKVIFEYRPSGRNQIMLTFLKSLTEAESDAEYVLPVGLAQQKIDAATVAAGTWTLEFGA